MNPKDMNSQFGNFEKHMASELRARWLSTLTGTVARLLCKLLRSNGPCSRGSKTMEIS